MDFVKASPLYEQRTFRSGVIGKKNLIPTAQCNLDQPGQGTISPYHDGKARYKSKMDIGIKE